MQVPSLLVEGERSNDIVLFEGEGADQGVGQGRTHPRRGSRSHRQDGGAQPSSHTGLLYINE